MQITTQHQDGVDIITVDANRIDAAVAIQFKDRMREVLGTERPRYVLDLHKVEFIDSSGLGAIVAGMKLLPKGGKLELAALCPAVDKVFRMTRMDSIFDIHQSVEAAASV